MRKRKEIEDDADAWIDSDSSYTYEQQCVRPILEVLLDIRALLQLQVGTSLGLKKEQLDELLTQKEG